MMGKIRWYKRDPNAALVGMFELTLEERGAYNTVLDLIYVRDGNLPDDDRFIAGNLRCDMRVWRRIKARLVELHKIYICDGYIRNSRADVEVDAALKRVQTATEAGIASGEIRRQQKVHQKDVGELTPVSVEEPRNSRVHSQPPNSDMELWKTSELARTDASTECEQTPELTRSKNKSKNPESSLRSDSMTPGGVDPPDLDVLLYQRGKALLGRKAGGQITRLRQACGGVGQALEAIEQARHKDSPAEYVAGIIRRKEGSNNGNGYHEAERRSHAGGGDRKQPPSGVAAIHRLFGSQGG